jgi:hypothetical protein
MIASTLEQASAEPPSTATYAHWAAAVLYNGLARHEEAASAAHEATSKTAERFSSVWARPDLVEAAVRSGDAELARAGFERLAETTQSCDNDFALEIEARSRALLTAPLPRSCIARRSTG